MRIRGLSRLAGISLAVVVGMVFTACSSTPKAATTTTTKASASVPSGLSVSSFNVNFTEMAKLKPLASSGTGLVGVILPDTTSSTRYVDFDAPYLTKAFQMAGYSSSDFKIDNAQGVDATELADAQADVSLGAKVLVFDPIDSTVGAEVQSYASTHGVAVISYDRATFTGTNTYYVSFDNNQVGKLIGQGFEACVAAWEFRARRSSSSTAVRTPTRTRCRSPRATTR